jgi:hypothetical protein
MLALELKPGDDGEVPDDCSGEVLSATRRAGYIYVRVTGRPDLCALEPHAQVTVTGFPAQVRIPCRLTSDKLQR